MKFSSQIQTAIRFVISQAYLRRRALKDILLPLLFGISIGIFFGFILNYETRSDVIDHIHVINHHEAKKFGDQNFSLRCVVIVHPQSSKPTKILQAMRDGFATECNQTIYYTTDEEFHKQLSATFPIVYIDSYSNEFFWNFYQQVMEFSAEVPAQWTYIGDDQTYLIVGNLRRTLRNFDPSENLILGRVTAPKSFLSYLFPLLSFEKVSVQAGVIVSNGAIDSFSECRGFLFPRSTETALYQCAREYGVRIVDPVDEDGQHLLHDNSPERLLPHTAPPTRHFYNLWKKPPPNPQTSPCCSDHSITFGQMSVNDMRVMQYGLNFHVFGKGGYVEVDKPLLITSPAKTLESTNSSTTTYAKPVRVQPVLRKKKN